MVVDGTTPGVVGHSTCIIDTEFIVGASEKFNEIRFVPKAPMEASAACVVDDLEVGDSQEVVNFDENTKLGSNPRKAILWKPEQSTVLASEATIDMVRSPIKPASGWEAAPADAKEFTILFSNGLIRRPALILKNEEGIYDRVAIYKKKKDVEPLVVCTIGKMVRNVADDAIKDDKTYHVIRNIKLLKLDENGSTLTMHVSMGMDTENDSVWHPKRLFKEVAENVGTPVPFSFVGHQEDMLITDCMLDNWYGVVVIKRQLSCT